MHRFFHLTRPFFWVSCGKLLVSGRITASNLRSDMIDLDLQRSGGKGAERRVKFSSIFFQTVKVRFSDADVPNSQVLWIDTFPNFHFLEGSALFFRLLLIGLLLEESIQVLPKVKPPRCFSHWAGATNTPRWGHTARCLVPPAEVSPRGEAQTNRCGVSKMGFQIHGFHHS